MTVSEGQDATMKCFAEGNPMEESMIKWIREDYDFSRTKKSFMLVFISIFIGQKLFDCIRRVCAA